MNKKTKLGTLPKGTYFKRFIKGKPTQKIYIKGDYNRSRKRFECNDVEDVLSNGIELKGNTPVTTDFEY